MLENKEELDRLRKEAVTKVEDPEWQMNQLKSGHRITQHRIDKHKVLIDIIAKGKWKDSEVKEGQLTALATLNLKILHQMKSEFESDIAKLERKSDSK